MTPEMVQYLRREVGLRSPYAGKLSRERFAALLGTTNSTVERWESGKHPPSPVYVRLMRELAEKHGISLDSELVDETV